MTEPGTTPLQHWRGGLCLGILAGLALGGAALADGPRHAMPVAVASRAPEPAKLQTTPGADIPASYDQDRQRRMLLLLVMRSAGPLGPYGALGR
jgi:hypothetical protein